MAAYTCIAILLGVLVGSFLNVVIHRLPLMMQQEQEEWINELVPGTYTLGKKVSLSMPSSNCPHCAAPIKWYYNIPLLSWIWLLGYSACCNKEISMRYPVTELFGGLMGIFAVTHYGVSAEALLMFTTACLLYCLVMIDARHMLLPDALVSGLLLSGMAYQVWILESAELTSAVIDMMIVYCTLVTTRIIASYVAGKEAMGFGDVKLLVAVAAWVGAMGVLWVLFLASLAIVVFYIVDPVKSKVYPFGPSLCIASIVVFYKLDVLNQYLAFA